VVCEHILVRHELVHVRGHIAIAAVPRQLGAREVVSNEVEVYAVSVQYAASALRCGRCGRRRG
jgi:hypothetical protein